MKTMPPGEFKARGPKVMDQVYKTREPVVITKRGKPAAKLVPPGKCSDDIFGCLKGQFEIVGDIESPIVPPEAWEANRWSFSTRTSSPGWSIGHRLEAVR